MEATPACDLEAGNRVTRKWYPGKWKGLKPAFFFGGGGVILTHTHMTLGLSVPLRHP